MFLTIQVCVSDYTSLCVSRESLGLFTCLVLLLVMAYTKTTLPTFQLNKAVKHVITHQLPPLDAITTREAWFEWTETSLLDAVDRLPRLLHNNKVSQP